MKAYMQYLTVNEFSRPGKRLHAVKGIVMHWTAAAAQDARAVRWYFECKKAGTGGYGSAHFIIGQEGEIVQCMPELEVAYHCGSSQADPKSGRIYTDEARARFGKYAENPDTLSPNLVTIGIELCPKDDEGNFTEKTLDAATELCAYLCRKYKLAAKDITTHHDVVGWKDCPRLWTVKPELLDAFRQRVKDTIVRDWIA